MPVEGSFNSIADLNPTWPEAADLQHTWDDHLRGLKQAIKNTFPNLDNMVVVTHGDLNLLLGKTSVIDCESSGLVSLFTNAVFHDNAPYLEVDVDVPQAAIGDYVKVILDTRLPSNDTIVTTLQVYYATVIADGVVRVGLVWNTLQPPDGIDFSTLERKARIMVVKQGGL